MKNKSKQLFEYLLAVNNLRFKVIRDFKEYEKSWTRITLEEYGDGVFLMGSGEDEEAILEIHRQSFSDDMMTPPKPDKSIKEWITYSYNNENSRLSIPATVLVQGEDELEVTFEEDASRVKLFNEWKRDWQGWADEMKRKKRVQALYEMFFKINQDFQVEGEGLELLLGQTIFTWEHEVGHVYHPLFTTKLDVELDTDLGVIRIKPINQGYKLELNILSGIPLPNMEEIKNIGITARYRDVSEEDVRDLLDNPFDRLSQRNIVV